MMACFITSSWITILFRLVHLPEGIQIRRERTEREEKWVGGWGGTRQRIDVPLFLLAESTLLHSELLQQSKELPGVIPAKTSAIN